MKPKRKPTRKRLRMLVTVSVPVRLTPQQARLEVKTLITDQANWGYAEYDDIKAVAVRAAPREVRHG